MTSETQLPRGLRNNNPGNMRPRPEDVSAFDVEGKLIDTLPDTVWQGVVALDVGPNGPYLIFNSMLYGLRAIGKQLEAYQLRYGLNTCRQIFTRWAPPSDNNPTPAYISAVAQRMGKQPDDVISTRNPDQLFELIQGVVQQEDGGIGLHYITSDEIRAAVNLVLNISQEA